MSQSDGAGVKSAERALTILELFSRLDRPLTFTQVAAQLGYPRSSLHGLLRTLTARGWLHLDPRSRRFSLGLRAWEVGAAHHPAADLARAAAPVLERLESDLDGCAHVAVLDGTEAVRVSGDRGARGGTRVAAPNSGAGRVLLADLDPIERDRRLGARTAAELESILAEVRAQGWGADDEEQAAEMRALAVPVRDGSGAVVAALAVQAPAARLDVARREEMVGALRAGAAQIAERLGGAAAYRQSA